VLIKQANKPKKAVAARAKALKMHLQGYFRRLNRCLPSGVSKRAIAIVLIFIELDSICQLHIFESLPLSDELGNRPSKF